MPAAPQSTPDWTNAFRPGRFAVMLGCLVVLSYPGVAACLETFVLRDFTAFGYPLAHYHRESIWAGEIPLWNPLSHTGVPFLAQWNSMALYPGSLIYILLPLEWSLSWFCLLHMFGAGMGAYFLVRHWTRDPFAAALAGIGYAFNGLLLNSLMWPNNIAALAWLPWVVWTVDLAMTGNRRSVATAALAGAMQMLTGAPEVILLGWLIVAVTAVARLRHSWREWQARQRCLILLRFPLIIVLVSGMAAAQLLPFFEWHGLANRTVEMDSVGWAAGPNVWANFLLPWFDCSVSQTGLYTHASQQWSHSFYPGIGLLILAPFALTSSTRGLAVSLLGLALICFLISLGETAFLYRWLKPLLREMRFPVKFLIPLSLIIPWLAALGWRHASTIRRHLTSAGLVLGLTGAAFAVALVKHEQGADAGFKWNTLQRLVALLLFTGGAVWHLHASSARAKTGTAIALLLILWADLRFHSPGMTPTAPTSIWANQPPFDTSGRIFLTPAVRKHFSASRSDSEIDVAKVIQQTMLANANLPVSIAKAYGFYSLPPADANDIMRSTVRDMNVVHEPMADFLGVTHAGVMSFNTLEWVARPSAMPLVTAGQRPMFGDRTNVLVALNSTRFNPRQMVALPPEESEHVIGGAAPGTLVTNLSISPHHIHFETVAKAPTLALIAQTWHPNWRATVNGQPTRLLRANVAFQALNIPVGQCRVDLFYVDDRFRLGRIISLITLVLTALLWCSDRWRRR